MNELTIEQQLKKFTDKILKLNSLEEFNHDMDTEQDTGW